MVGRGANDDAGVSEMPGGAAARKTPDIGGENADAFCRPTSVPPGQAHLPRSPTQPQAVGLDATVHAFFDLVERGTRSHSHL